MDDKRVLEREFTRGWIMAVSTVFHRTGDDVSCYETMCEAGIEWGDLAEFDLCELDHAHMVRIFWHHGLSAMLGREGMSAAEYLATQETP